MLLAMHLDYRLLRRPAVVYTLLVGVLVLLGGVLFAPELNHTRRWFFVGGLSVQPSELAKLALVVFLAYQIDKKPDRVNSRELLVPCALVVGLAATLILLEPDLGTALLLASTALVLLFLAGLSWRYLAAGLLLAAPVVALLVITEPYRLVRLLAFLHPERDPHGSGFQPLQSLIAVGSGGVLGLGPGASVQKLYFLPYPHSDFIYAIVAEELGAAGAVGVLALFALLLWRGVRAGLRAPDVFGRYLAWGLCGVVLVQALVNVSVALALLPTKGIPLPFISYGGSSLVVSMTACGVMLNVSQHG
jgi:cell division protein FtsW